MRKKPKSKKVTREKRALAYASRVRVFVSKHSTKGEVKERSDAITPTLLTDKIDTFLTKDIALRRILNSEKTTATKGDASTGRR
jgi:hypothetical protein